MLESRGIAVRLVGRFLHPVGVCRACRCDAVRSLNLQITKEQLIAMAQAITLDIPDSDLENVRLRLSGLLTEMEAIERELGAQMDAVEPIPPVYPREEF